MTNAENVGSGVGAYLARNHTLPKRRAAPLQLLLCNSASNLDLRCAPTSPSVRSVTSRTRFNVKKTPSPKRRVVKRYVSASPFSSFVKSFKMKKTKATAMGRVVSRIFPVGRSPEAVEMELATDRRRLLAMERNYNEAQLMDDFAQYLVSHRNKPFSTPPRTPTYAHTDTGSPLESSPESAKSRMRVRSQMKSLQILGPEACRAVTQKWREGAAE